MMTLTATITKCSYDPRTFKALPIKYETIEAENRDKLFALFFREYANRYKYCNDTHYEFTDANMLDGYHEWFSDVNNYADNGGDMW